MDCQVRSDLDWLNEFLQPWFGISRDPANVEVKLVFDRRRFQDLCANPESGRLSRAYIQDTNIVRFPELSVPGFDTALLDKQLKLVTLVGEGCIILLGQSHDVLARKALMKTVREIAASYCHVAGGRFLHAAACELDGAGLAIAGPRGSGKTSLLLYMLLATGFRFVTSDRLLVAGGEAVGLPTIVSIRNGTLDRFPEFAGEVEKRGYGLPLTLKECARDPGLNESYKMPHKISLSSRQLSEILGKSPSARTELRGLVFPRVDPAQKAWSLTPLDTPECIRRLSGAGFGYINPHYLSDAFSVVKPDPDRRRTVPDDEFYDGLSQTLPAWDCALGRDAFRDMALADAIGECSA